MPQFIRRKCALVVLYFIGYLVSLRQAEVPPEQLEPVDLSVKPKEDQAHPAPQPVLGHGLSTPRLPSAPLMHGKPHSPYATLPKPPPVSHAPPRPPSGPVNFSGGENKTQKLPGGEQKSPPASVTPLSLSDDRNTTPSIRCKQLCESGMLKNLDLRVTKCESPSLLTQLPRYVKSSTYETSSRVSPKLPSHSQPSIPSVPQCLTIEPRTTSSASTTQPARTLSTFSSSEHHHRHHSLSTMLPSLTVEPRTASSNSRNSSPPTTTDHKNLAALDLPGLHVNLPLPGTPNFTCLSPEQMVGTSGSPLRNSDPAFLLHLSRFQNSLQLPPGLDLTLKPGN